MPNLKESVIGALWGGAIANFYWGLWFFFAGAQQFGGQMVAIGVVLLMGGAFLDR